MSEKEENKKNLEKSNVEEIKQNEDNEKNVKEEVNVEVKENSTSDKNDESKDEKAPKTKNRRVLTFSLVGGIAVVILLIIVLVVISLLGKPSKKQSEKLIKDYLSAINDKDGDEYIKLIDTKGYIVFKEESEKKFDKKYKDKNYIKKYLKDNSYEDISDVEDSISSEFKSKYGYYSREYSFKEISEIKKSGKSKKIKIIKAKVKTKSKYSSNSDTVNLKLYVIKVDGNYKIVGAEMD